MGSTVCAVHLGACAHPFGALAYRGELLEVVAVHGGEPQRLGQGRKNLSRGAIVAALFEPGELFDADAGQGGKLRTA